MAWEMDFTAWDETLAQLEAAVPVALARAAEHVRGVAVELTPIEIGDLRQSASVRVVNHNEVIIEYNSVYARYQHYGLDFRHPRGGQALFLEQPMLTEVAACQRIIADTVQEMTNG